MKSEVSANSSSPLIWRTALCDPQDLRPCRFVAGLQLPVAQGDYCPRHSHRCAEIVYHPIGRGTTRLDHKTIDFNEGSAVIYAPNEVHDQSMDISGRDLCVHIALPEKLAARRLHHGMYVPRVESLWLIEDLQRLTQSRVKPNEPDQCVLDLRATSVLLALIEAACSHSEDLAASAALLRVRRAEQFIQENFATIRALGEVATDAGLSHDHLRHLFKSITGRSLVHYLNDVRVSRARLLLLNSPVPLKQIAALCGFRDEYYFSAVFRRFTGFAPGVYRNRSNSNLIVP